MSDKKVVRSSISVVRIKSGQTIAKGDLLQSNGDGTAAHYDFHSNGFKNTYSGGSLNSSGRNYLYVAFAENPIVGSNNIQATAR